MATLSVTSAATARSVMGYWDDSGAARVDGTAVAGDTIVISSGPIDLGANDNILYPPAGVTIQGSGINTASEIIGRFWTQGSGGTAVVTTLRNWLLTSTGLADIGGILGPGDAATVNGAMDVTLVIDGFRNYDASPASASNNLFTVFSENGDATVLALRDAQFEGAGADCFSTKGDVLREPMCLRFGGQFDEWGSGASNNGYTGHDNWNMYGWGGSCTRATPAGQAIAHDTNVADAYDANVTISGGGFACNTLVNSQIDIGSLSIQSTLRTLSQYNAFTGATNGVIRFLTDGAEISDCSFASFGVSTVSAIDFSDAGTFAMNRLVIDGGRGIDMRSSAGTVNLDNSIIKTSSFAALKDDPGGTMNTTNNRVSTAGFNVPFTGSGDVIAAIAQGVVDARVAEIAARVGQAPEPSAGRIVSLVESGNGGVLLGLTPAQIVAAYPIYSTLRRGKYFIGLNMGTGL